MGSGRHRLICVGGAEKIFYTMPNVEHFATFGDLDRYLTAAQRDQAMKKAA
jgi:hypothetical protein